MPLRRRPSTRSVRLILAGAVSVSTKSFYPSGRAVAGSAAVAGLFGALVGLRRRFFGEPVLELLLDLRQFFRIGLEVARMRPLEVGLERAADAPVGVAEMVVDGRIFGLQLDGALELLGGLSVI